MSKVAAKKIEEGNNLLKQADKAVSKGFFKKPDYEMGASYYDKAAVCFKIAKKFSMARKSFEKASQAHYDNHMPYSAGKSLEQAGNMALEAKKPDEAASLFQQASMFYREDGKVDKGAEVMIKAAQTIGDTDKDAAMTLYKDAAELYAEEDKEFKAGPLYKKSIAFALRNNCIKDAIEMYNNQIKACERLDQKHQIHKCRLSIIILHLHNDDVVGAQNYYSEASSTCAYGFPGSEESEAAGDLLAAYSADDDEALKAVTGKQLFTFLDNEVAKLARKLELKDGLL
mmetsp:Transcript_14407/g.24635  ORF Transcript_14407/g.24635 Transcript_14407/m.24635 type:complete len:285 (-) Transcript_14407:37-891(-)